MSLPNLDTLDHDHAIRDAAAEVEGDTRGAFLRKTALGGGALLSSGAIMGLLPEIASAKPSKKRDTDILNFALTLEFLEAAFYKEVLSKNVLTGDVLALTRLVADHEATHVSALKAAVKNNGGHPVPKPTFDFGNTTGDQTTYLATAYVLENTGVHAYLGQATKLKSKALLKAAASIVTIEARHASAFAILVGDTPYDVSGNSVSPSGAFDRGFSKKHILRLVGDTKFIVKS